MIKLPHILIALGIMTLVGCSEESDSSYATLGDAKAAGAISRGWLPECLPPSTREIKEHHNIDTNLGWISFMYDPVDSLMLLRAIKPVSDGSVRHLQLSVPPIPFRYSLSAGGLHKALAQDGFRFFSVQYEQVNQAGTVFATQWHLAINLPKGIGYGWLKTAIRPKAAGA